MEAFHGTLVAALAGWIGAAAEAHGFTRVALGGGCLMNRVLAEGLTAALAARGLEPALPRLVPANDGGLSFGQAAFALAALRAEAGRAVMSSGRRRGRGRMGWKSEQITNKSLTIPEAEDRL